MILYVYWLSGLTGMVLFVYWFWTTRRRSGEPPILSGSLPLIGHAYNFMLRDAVQLWEKLKELTNECLKNGHVIYFLIGTKKVYVLTDPDDINHVSNVCLQKDTIVSELMKRLLREGLVFAKVPKWKKHRKLIQPTFNQQILDSYLPTFNAQARVLVKKMEKKSGNGPFDFTNYLKITTLHTIFLTAIGIEINDDEALNYITTFETAIDIGVERFYKFWLTLDFIYNFTNLKKKEDSCLKTLQAMSEFVMSKKRNMIESREKSNVNNEKGKKNFLEQLLYFSNDLSEKEKLDEIHTMILAGSDTSSSVLMYALLLIGSYPKVQEKIVKELKNIFGDSDRDVEKKDLGKMIYSEAVLRETMRYYVMAPFIGRYLDKEVKLKNYVLQPGNDCVFSLHGVHRHEMWGGDADQFRPERWLENKLPSNSYAFIPFSIGKRNCIGQTYAMMLMKTILYHVFRRYKIHADHTKLILKYNTLLKPAYNYDISIENN